MGQKAGMGRAAMSVVIAGFVEAELAVHRHTHFAGVIVLLAVVLPPADRAQRQRAGRLQRLISAARAAKSIFHNIPRMDGRKRGQAGLHEKQGLATPASIRRGGRSPGTPAGTRE